MSKSKTEEKQAKLAEELRKNLLRPKVNKKKPSTKSLNTTTQGADS